MGAGDGHLLERRISVDREDEEDSVLVYCEPVRAARAVGLKEFAKHVLHAQQTSAYVSIRAARAVGLKEFAKHVLQI